MIDPVYHKVVTEMTVMKIFDSKAKPLLVNLFHTDSSNSQVICKKRG